jgi:hypothetical protein
MPAPLYLDVMEDRTEQAYNDRQRLFKKIEESNLTSEGKVVQQIHKYLKSNGWFQLNLISTSPSGIPDRVAFKDGRYIWFEIKKPGGRLQPNQEYMIDKMKSYGMEVYVVDSLEEVKRICKG